MILPYSADDDAAAKLKEMGYNIIKITTKLVSKKKHPKFIHVAMNCVSVIRYISGTTLYAFTPYGFYKRLLKMHQNGKFKNNIVKVEMVK